MSSLHKLSPEVVRAISAGGSFFASMFSGFILGQLLDSLRGQGIAFSIAGTLLGLVAGNYSVYRLLVKSSIKKKPSKSSQS